jgi:transposase
VCTSPEPVSWTTIIKIWGAHEGGLTSKIRAVVDTNGLPVYLALTPGEAHDNRLCSVLLSALLPRTMLLGDRGYDADWIRELARQQGAWANIPPKRNRKDPICFSPYLYRARNLIERFFNKIKQCRRVATRYDKLAANYLAFIKLAAIRIWLRANESTALKIILGRYHPPCEQREQRGHFPPGCCRPAVLMAQWVILRRWETIALVRAPVRDCPDLQRHPIRMRPGR